MRVNNIHTNSIFSSINISSLINNQFLGQPEDEVTVRNLQNFRN